MTPDEEARLQLRAGQLGVSVSRLLYESAVAEQGETLTERRAALTALFALHRTLAGVANNLNQMTKEMHTVGALPPEVPECAARVRVVAEHIDRVLDELALK